MNIQVNVNVTLPDDLTDLDSSKVSRDVLEQVVAVGYKEDRLSLKQVRLLLGFSSRLEAEDFLHRHRAMEYTTDDLKHDLETMDRLGLR
jgi:hypothetical protein